MNKTIDEYFETHTEPVELAFGTFYPAADGNVRLVMRDGSEITAFAEEDLQDFYEEHAAGEFRICSVCGSPMDAGYMCEGSDFYACSDTCLHHTTQQSWISRTVVPGDPVLTEETAPDGSMHSLSGNTRLQRWQNCLPDPGRDMTWQKTWGLPIRVLT